MSKRMRAIHEQLTKDIYLSEEAFTALKEFSKVKFDEAVDVSVKLGIDARKSEQSVRGATNLPHGTGKTVKVAVFAQGDKADLAKEAGADIVGFEDLAADVKKGQIDFDVVIATPDAMKVVGQLGQILGPKGLMPNPKVGTVTVDVAAAVKNAKAGQVRYRNDKAGIIHCNIGKVSFDASSLRDNLLVLIADIRKLQPSSAKGTYIKKVSVSSTMGPGLVLDLAELK